MSEQPIQDINDGKPLSEMDRFDLRNSLAYGRSIDLRLRKQRYSITD